MKIKSIEFENYRCFIDGVFTFDTDGEKNISIIIGPNGGGKTETLLAFRWVLYDVDFSKLLGKKETPYALNSDMYKELEEQGENGDTKSCSVSLEIEYNDKVYRVTKTATYKKTPTRVNKPIVNQVIREYKENGELSLPIEDPKDIKTILTRMIPKSILEGIVFDGERMTKLSSSEETAKNAIKGVINDITNVELLEKTKMIYSDIHSDLIKAIKKCASRNDNRTLEEIVDSINDCNDAFEEKNEKLLINEERLEDVKIEISNKEEELKQIEEVRELEYEKESENRIVEDNKKLLNDYYKDFASSLKEAYLLKTHTLMDKVDDIIKKIDVPKGLTVEAVKSILEKEDCICGRHIGRNEIDILNELISTLPPDNINSTLAEMIRQTKERVKEVNADCNKNYNYIVECEKKIDKSKERIASLSKQIQSPENGEEAEKIEKAHSSLLEEKGRLESIIPELKKDIKDIKREIEKLEKERDDISSDNEETEKLNKQLKFTEKCLDAIEEIRNNNKEKALSMINKKIEVAYKTLSEDAELGNSLYIVQFEESKKYQMIVYLKDVVNDLLEEWEKNGVYDEYVKNGLTKEEIIEEAILKSADGSSTGQSKMNTLSFVKAILDYSTETKDEHGVEIQKDYPLIIDAPFSDISGDNLTKSSSELHNFSSQIILMIDKDKYKIVSKHITPYINNMYHLEKNKGKNVSTMKKEK